MTAPTERLGPITKFALVCVAIIMVYLMALSAVLVWLVRSDWCAVAIGNAKYVNGRPDFAISGCIDLLKLQVQALATNSWITIGIFGAVLFVLMVIVVARGKASVHAPGGFGASVGGDEVVTPADGAQVAADAAQGAADAVKEGQMPPLPEGGER